MGISTRAGQLAIAFQVVVHQRSLEPGKLQGLQLPGHPQRAVPVVVVLHVQHQGQPVWSMSLADGPSQLQVPVGHAPAVELDGPESLLQQLVHEVQVGGNVLQHGRAGIGGNLPAGSTQKLVDGQIGGFAQQVPERDVHHRQGSGGQGKDARPEAAPQGLPFERVPSDERRNQVPERLGRITVVSVGGVVGHSCNAFDPFVGENSHHRVGHVLFRQVMGPGEALHLGTHHPDLDPVNAHGSDSFSSFSLGS